MYAGRDFSSADPGEIKNYSFDFTPVMPSDITIVSTVWKLSTVLGSDDDAAGRFASEATLDGSSKVATRRIGPLREAVKYRVECLATTSDGSKVGLHAHIRCGFERA